MILSRFYSKYRSFFNLEAPVEMVSLGSNDVLGQLGLLRGPGLGVQDPSVESGNHELQGDVRMKL